MKIFRKVLVAIVLILIAGLAIRYYWVFGEGVKAGQLNYMVRKGVLFKTYEGKLIQTGIRTQNASLHSYEFDFSVDNKDIAEQLMVHSGEQFNLHYKEYLGALPWRGHSIYVVDSIISSEKVDH